MQRGRWAGGSAVLGARRGARCERAQPFDDAREHVEEPFDLLSGVLLAERDSQAAASQLVRHTHRQQHVRWLQGGGGAAEPLLALMPRRARTCSLRGARSSFTSRKAVAMPAAFATLSVPARRPFSCVPPRSWPTNGVRVRT